MSYKITCLVGVHSYEDFSIKEGQTLEASKEVYDYYNTYFGTSGKFTFAILEEPKKSSTKEVAKESKPEVSDIKSEG